MLLHQILHIMVKLNEILAGMQCNNFFMGEQGFRCPSRQTWLKLSYLCHVFMIYWFISVCIYIVFDVKCFWRTEWTGSTMGNGFDKTVAKTNLPQVHSRQ